MKNEKFVHIIDCMSHNWLIILVRDEGDTLLLRFELLSSYWRGLMKERGKILHLVSKVGWSICSKFISILLFKSSCESALTVIPPFEKHFGYCFDSSCLLWSLNYIPSLGYHSVVGLIVTSVHVHYCQQLALLTHNIQVFPCWDLW